MTQHEAPFPQTFPDRRSVSGLVGKRDPIVEDLRQHIVAGEYPAGSRLPIRKHFEDLYGVSSMTILRAFQSLAQDGFIVTRGRAGTFVTDRPPHLFRYGLVMSYTVGDPADERGRKFTNFLHQEAQELRRSAERDIVVYAGVNGHADNEDFRTLAEDVQRHRIAGLVFDSTTFLAQPLMAELLEQSQIPCVCTAAGALPGNMMALQMDGTAALERSMAFLASRGRRHPAVLLSANDHVNHQAIDAIQRTASAHGIRVQTSFIQPIHPLLARFANNTVRLMMETGNPPDSIVIHDDVLVEPATSALRDMQIRCPEQVVVVAHANFPYITPSLVEATRIGFDVSAFLRAGLELIDRKCRGEACASVSRVSPMFEQEWAAQTSANRFVRMR